mmetsp:Transcript_16253/g.32541  ORF Transcript_16253/g.32541 Transcript_16253/m.32541 type:complete len:381 (+) Transcript_16253:151-1293(+)
MPGVAHAVVSSAYNYGKNKVEETKTAGGYTKWVVETIERPVNYTLDTRVVGAGLKVGDFGLTIADKIADRAIESGRPVYKIVKPATTAVANTVSKTTTAVVTPIANAYTGAVTVADNVVDRVLPEPAEPKLAPVTAVGVTMKVGRRVRVRSGRMVTRTRQGAGWCVDQARPTNVKKNVVAVYNGTLQTVDSFVDKYLPDDDNEVAKGPITLGKKVVKRTYKKSIAAVKYAATAIKNSPTTFKNAYKTVSSKAKQIVLDTTGAIKNGVKNLASMRIRVRVITFKDLQPYLFAAQDKSLAVIKTTDDALMKFRVTALLRNFAVNRYQFMIAPVVNRFVSSAPAESAKPAVEAPKAAPAKPAAPPQQYSAPAPAPAPAPEPSR